MMMRASPPGDPVMGLAQFVRSERGAILLAWNERIGRLPVAKGPSLASRGERVLEWLARSLEEQRRDEALTNDLPTDETFSAPRAIAELALLTAAIDELQPASVDDVARRALHRVIDAAIAHSLARDSDENDCLRTRLRLAADVTLVGSWEVDPASGVVAADLRSRELFGMADGQPATLDALTLNLHADDRERVRAGIANTVGSGQPYLDEGRTSRTDDLGPLWIAIATEAHRGAHEAVPRVLGIVHDISDRKRTEEEHARVVEELSRAVHISAMFVGILSHDLRNPLSAILAGAQLLGHGLPEDRAARILSRLVSSGQRMGRMIDQLLDFTRARIGEGIPLACVPVDLAPLAEEVVEEGRAASPAALLLVATQGDTSGSWDRDRVSQILSNLVGNALQHGETSTAIEVALDGSRADRVELTVKNRGAIPPHLMPIIFNPFRGTLQKRGKSKGLGLGLYVARQIALAHGGDLVVETTATDTAFTLRLPRTASSGVMPSKPDFVREEELAAFERLAAPPSTSAVTAQLFGATPLHERVPLEYADIVGRYGQLLDTALHRKAYRGQGEGLADDLRALAERLGDLGGGPREVTEVHARALRLAVRGVTAAKTQALLSEGRLLALELMGNLAAYYRRRSRGQVRETSGARSSGEFR